MKYFAPLSSFKPKHKRLCETIDFIKIGDMAVLNLNNMFPVPGGVYSLKNPNTEQNCQYKTLLNNEIRIIKQKSEIIINNAKAVYEHKMTNDGKSKLSQRCNDFKLLEIKCREYKSKQQIASAIYLSPGRWLHASVLTEFASKLAGIILGILRGQPLRRRAGAASSEA